VVLPSLGFTVPPKLWSFRLQCSLFLQNCDASVFRVYCSSKIMVLLSSGLNVPPKLWCFRLQVFPVPPKFGCFWPQDSLCMHSFTNDLSDCMATHPISPKSSKTNRCMSWYMCHINFSRAIASGKQIWPRFHVIHFNVYTRELPCYQWKGEGSRVTVGNVRTRVRKMFGSNLDWGTCCLGCRFFLIFIGSTT
jgi:hypothetical protein